MTVILMNRDLPETGFQINSGDESSMTKQVESVINTRQGINVFYRLSIKPTIIDTEAPSTAWFAGEDSGRSIRRMGLFSEVQ